MLKLEDVPTPGPGEVVVEIRAADVSGSVGTAVDYTKPGYSEDARTLTANKGPELILEMMANINLAAKYGRIIIGNRGDITFTPRVAIDLGTTR